MRHIVLGLLILLAFGPRAWAEPTLRIIPPPGAMFAPGQRFDIRIEGDDLRGQPGLSRLKSTDATRNARSSGPRNSKRTLLRRSGRGATTSTTLNGGVTRRNWSLERPGKYEIKATLTTVDGKKLTATSTIQVETLQPTPNRAKNVILFVGDGMGPAIRTAARIISKGVEGGRTRRAS